MSPYWYVAIVLERERIFADEAAFLFWASVVFSIAQCRKSKFMKLISSTELIW
jgi:hypothetical protein